MSQQQEVIDTILTAVNIGNGKAAEEAADILNEKYVLIRRSDLPAIENHPHHFRDQQVPTARTAGYRLGCNPQTYWNRALDFISVAIYAEQEAVKQAERELTGMREEAWKLLHPYEAMWDYDTQPPASQKQIDVVVNLMRQVDELKASK